MEENKDIKAIDAFIEKVKETCGDASGFICIAFRDVELKDGKKGIVSINPEPIAVGAVNIYYASQKLMAIRKKADEIKAKQNILSSCSSEKEAEELLA